MVTVAKKKPAPGTTSKAAAKPSVKRTRSTAPTPQKASTTKTALPKAPIGEASATKADKKKAKLEKIKVVRDSFTIPKAEYAQIAILKKRALSLGLDIKKSELLRAGLALLTGSSDAALRKALGNVPTLKTGRPGKA